MNNKKRNTDNPENAEKLENINTEDDGIEYDADDDSGEQDKSASAESKGNDKKQENKSSIFDRIFTEEEIEEDRSIICNNLSFAGAEAYKLLRANLLFSLPSEKKCKIVGVTGSIRADGKSLTSINMAYTLAETGRKVLLIEADMRLPNIGKRLSLKSTPGLSNLLVNMSQISETVQKSNMLRNFYVITAGDVPPNPSELLGSSMMANLIESFSKLFSYIVIDLPPVNIVSDALVVSKLTDGIVFVVRQDHTSRSEVSKAMSRLKLVDAKVLGFVMNDVSAKNSLYSRYKRYGYYSRYNKYNKYGKYGKYGKYASYSKSGSFNESDLYAYGYALSHKENFESEKDGSVPDEDK